MGTYLNPGNSLFSRNFNGCYVDKTCLISLINSTVETPDCLTCINRPRRFGKSYAAQMLCAYYDYKQKITQELIYLYPDLKRTEVNRQFLILTSTHFLNPEILLSIQSFTEDEVKNLYDKYHVDFLKIKKRYDGYTVGNVESVYNPYSVMSAIRKNKFTSYWKYTSATDNLLTYINLNLRK